MTTAKNDRKSVGSRQSGISEVECWREARSFTAQIYRLTDSEDFADDSLLVGLLRSQALAVMAKISEGYHHLESQVFSSCLNQAIGHLGEVVSHLYFAHDRGCLPKDDLNQVLSTAYTTGIRIHSDLKTLLTQTRSNPMKANP